MHKARRQRRAFFFAAPVDAEVGDMPLSSYASITFSHGPWTRPVYRKGSGPAVIIIHEIPGPHPGVFAFADRVAARGMTVYLPILFGEVGREISGLYTAETELALLCVRREFNIWHKGRSSPIVDWLRALAKQAHEDCGGKGVGAVGMCFTGGFALAMMTEPAVVAPVLSQPALPIGFAGFNRATIDASEEEIACVRRRMEEEDLSLIALRFRSDPLVPDERFDLLRQAFGKRFEAIELKDADAPPGSGQPHSVLTVHLRADGPTHEAAERVISFFAERTGA